MASQTRTAGTGANDNTVGSVAWSNPGNITADDSSLASNSVGIATTNYLKATNFGFSIPASSIVDGLVVTFDRIGAEVGGIPSQLSDSAVRIVKGGAIGSTNRSTGAAWATAGFELANFGSSSDLWGETWVPADVNLSSFGAVISAQGSNSDALALVDHVTITVHYSEFTTSTSSSTSTSSTSSSTSTSSTSTSRSTSTSSTSTSVSTSSSTSTSSTSTSTSTSTSSTSVSTSTSFSTSTSVSTSTSFSTSTSTTAVDYSVMPRMTIQPFMPSLR